MSHNLIAIQINNYFFPSKKLLKKKCFLSHLKILLSLNKNIFLIKVQNNIFLVYFLWRFDPIIGYGLPLRGFALTLIGNTAPSTTPVDELPAQSRHHYMTTNKSHKRQTSVSRRYSNPQFQQASFGWGTS